MFDLEKAVKSWRESLCRAMPERSDAVDELESHLRDQTDQLISAGHSPEQAWEIALSRLGETSKLAEQFGVAASGVWLPARLSIGFLIIFALLLSAVLLARLSQGRMDTLLAIHVWMITFGYVAALTIGVVAMIAIAFRAFGKLSPQRDEAFRRTGLRISYVAIVPTLIGILLGMAWARVHLGHWWQWDPREIGGLCVLGWSSVLLSCFRWRTVPVDSAMLGGVVGNIVVATGWFGPVVLQRRADWYGPVLCLFVLIHLVWIYAGLLPKGWAKSILHPQSSH